MITVTKVSNYSKVGANSCTDFTGIVVNKNGDITYVRCPFSVEKVGQNVLVYSAFGEKATWLDNEFSYANTVKKANTCCCVESKSTSERYTENLGDSVGWKELTHKEAETVSVTGYVGNEPRVIDWEVIDDTKIRVRAYGDTQEYKILVLY